MIAPIPRRRRVLRVLCGRVALALCVGALLAWVVSLFMSMQVFFGAGDLFISRGSVWLEWWGAERLAEIGAEIHRVEPRWTDVWGDRPIVDRTRDPWRVRVPLWLLVGLCGFVAWLAGRRPAKAVEHGGCARCGYDLRGNVSGTCPECGTVRSAVAGVGRDDLDAERLRGGAKQR